MILYHGSEFIIEKPEFGKGKPYNDYGKAFYCTESYDLAAEWAVSENRDGFVNCYDFDIDGLSVLNLCDEKYSILEWLCLLIQNRTFDSNNQMIIEGKKYISERYSINYEGYDVITGWRADDSYFSFARAFLSNTISLNQLERAMKLGDLGTQIAIVSEKAFNRLSFDKYNVAKNEIYYSSKKLREEGAVTDYRKMCSESTLPSETFILDLIRKG